MAALESGKPGDQLKHILNRHFGKQLSLNLPCPSLPLFCFIFTPHPFLSHHLLLSFLSPSSFLLPFSLHSSFSLSYSLSSLFLLPFPSSCSMATVYGPALLAHSLIGAGFSENAKLGTDFIIEKGVCILWPGYYCCLAYRHQSQFNTNPLMNFLIFSITDMDKLMSAFAEVDTLFNSLRHSTSKVSSMAVPILVLLIFATFVLSVTLCELTGIYCPEEGGPSAGVIKWSSWRK